MGNRFAKRIKFSSNNNNTSKSKSQKKSVKKVKIDINSKNNEEAEFKFILNDVLNSNSNSLEFDVLKLSQEYNSFINSKKTGSLQHVELLDAYYAQLDCLATSYALSLNPNKILVKLVRATCFTRDQETYCTKLYLKLQRINKKNSKCLIISINDIFISSLEAISIGSCEALVDYLKENLSYKDYLNEINRLYNKKFLLNSNEIHINSDVSYLSFSTVQDVTTPKEYLTTLDSFIWKYLKQLSIYIHKNDYIIANELKLTLVDNIRLIHKLINSGFKVNNNFYDEQKLYKYNVLFLMYYKIKDLSLFKENQEALELCLNSCLKQILTLVKTDGFRKYTDMYRSVLYYKLKKCTFQQWSDENRILISELITNKKKEFQPLLLSDFCRLTIRNNSSNESIEKLDLPRKVLDFLKFKDDVEEDIDLYFQIAY
jgi:hypothetical protein